jgi:hypothetical protein
MKLVEPVGIADQEIDRAALWIRRSLLQEHLDLAQVHARECTPSCNTRVSIVTSVQTLPASTSYSTLKSLRKIYEIGCALIQVCMSVLRWAFRPSWFEVGIYQPLHGIDHRLNCPFQVFEINVAKIIAGLVVVLVQAKT